MINTKLREELIDIVSIKSFALLSKENLEIIAKDLLSLLSSERQKAKEEGADEFATTLWNEGFLIVVNGKRPECEKREIWKVWDSAWERFVKELKDKEKRVKE